MMCERSTLSDDPFTEKRLRRFAERIGYQISKINGQRTLGPPINWRQNEPPKGSEVFVARIPASYCEEDLYKILIGAGIIYKIRWMITFSTGNRGFAFVTFINPECARKAVQLYNNSLIYERVKKGIKSTKLGVVLSLDKTDLVISPIPSSTPLSKLLSLIQSESLNVVGIEEIDKSTTSKYKKVIIKFDENRSAALARRCLIAARSALSTNFSVEWYRDPKLSETDMSKYASSSSASSTKKGLFKTGRNPKPISQSSNQNFQTDNKTYQIIPKARASNSTKPPFDPSFTSALNQAKLFDPVNPSWARASAFCSKPLFFHK